MALSVQFHEFLEFKLSSKIESVTTVNGGSINDVYCLQTTGNKLLIKINNELTYPGMFECERAGLESIGKTGAIAVPAVVLLSNFNGHSFLVLEWISSCRPTIKSSLTLAGQLANLHRCSAGSFGLPYSNYMGSLSQSNRPRDTWSDFFIRERLLPQVNMAADKNLLIKSDLDKFEMIYKKLPDLFQEEAPALIHGDLWSGNYLISEQELPYLIDPAITNGHREFDMAMTTLFGGFLREFYDAYHESFPLAAGWEQRIDLWNLYPLLVHLNLFGVGYLGQLRSNLNRYV